MLYFIPNQDLSNLKQQVWDSLKEHLFIELEYFLKAQDWQKADEKTWKLMLLIANTRKKTWLSTLQLKNFSCADLNKIDNLWLQNSGGYFGFSVQKKIWLDTGNRLAIKPKDWNENDTLNYSHFPKAIGWYDDTKGNETWLSYEDFMQSIKDRGIFSFGGGYL